jgi:long-chain acyl-CoA synthetase
MREFTGPGEVTIAPDDNVVTAFLERARTKPTAAALAFRDGNAYKVVTAGEMADTVRRLAAGFIGLGIEPGSKICLFSKTRIEFTLLDYAIWAAGCVTVPIYETSSADQVRWVVGNSEAVALLVENDELKSVYDAVAGDLPECRHVFLIDGGGLDALRAAGSDVDPAAVDERVAGISHDDLATLVYTSGTTGLPKGCELTHRNFIWDVRQVISQAQDLLTEDRSTLMFLPLAHIFARVVQAACVTTGVTLAYSTGIKNLVEELSLYPPDWVFSVPRVFEKIYNTAVQKAGGGLKGKIFEAATATAISMSKERQAGGVSFGTKSKYALFDKLVYSKLRHTFGGKLQWAISGGAPLGERLGHYFNGIGVLVLEGYGLTETTAGATINTPEHVRIGTVGRPFPGASVHIADDGEVLLKGGMVFRGYWKNEEATAAAFTEDGWFKSGDLGSLDEDGFLSITGRKKELIITAGGKNVQPAVLEDTIRASAVISQCMVIGDAKPFVAALVTLDPEELPNWAARHGKTLSPDDDPVLALRDDPDLRAAVQEAVDRANQHVSKAEAIREFRILDSDFSIEQGELTPTLKVKRTVVLERYADAVKSIYGD